MAMSIQLLPLVLILAFIHLCHPVLEYRLIEFETLQVDERFLFIEYAKIFDMVVASLKARSVVRIDYGLVRNKSKKIGRYRFPKITKF